jgi:hypothetical protein
MLLISGFSQIHIEIDISTRRAARFSLKTEVFQGKRREIHAKAREEHAEKHPSTNIQPPEKHQASSSKAESIFGRTYT